MGYKVLTVKDTVYLNDKAVVMCGSFCSKYKWEKSTDDENNWSTLTETGSVITVTLDELKDVHYKCTLDSSCGIKHEPNKVTEKYGSITIAAPKGKMLYIIRTLLFENYTPSLTYFILRCSSISVSCNMFHAYTMYNVYCILYNV